jgi:hypothetical protein
MKLAQDSVRCVEYIVMAVDLMISNNYDISS